MSERFEVVVVGSGAGGGVIAGELAARGWKSISSQAPVTSRPGATKSL